MKKITYFKFALDIIMAITFVLLFNKMVLGGLAFHEIAGLAISFAFLTHILLNLQWVRKVTVKLFDRKLPGKTRFGYLLNLLLLISMTFIIVSGILVSRVVFPNINIGDEPWFKLSHISISFLTLILVAIHVGLHWQWVINVLKNIFKIKPPKLLLGVIAKVATVIILLFGGYQMYSTGFVSKLEGLGIVFNITSPQMPTGGEGKPKFGKGPMGENGHAPSAEFGSGSMEGNNVEIPNRPHGDIKGGFGQSPSALGVITTYFGIMSVFIIITYYLEKLTLRNKRKTKMIQDF